MGFFLLVHGSPCPLPGGNTIWRKWQNFIWLSTTRRQRGRNDKSCLHGPLPDKVVWTVPKLTCFLSYVCLKKREHDEQHDDPASQLRSVRLLGTSLSQDMVESAHILMDYFKVVLIEVYVIGVMLQFTDSTCPVIHSSCSSQMHCTFCYH